jgi:hypothetical protein
MADKIRVADAIFMPESNSPILKISGIATVPDDPH